jgi:3-deoxy-D-manno-octulosonate 8-phosphate phosphatase (KDO 8-P phosphatase)
MNAIVAKASTIRLVVFDVDGVLTDGSLYLGDGGEEYKAFYSRDGLGMDILQKTGVQIGIITGRTSQVVQYRMQSLGIKQIMQGVTDKLPAFMQMCQELALETTQVAYVGDDLIDIPVLKCAGLAIAVADAHPSIFPYVHWRTEANGGRGAAREVCELIMRAQGTLNAQLQRFGVEPTD